MRLVILESPFAGEVELNTAYARACLHHSITQGEAPIASHLLYTQPGVLDDNMPAERELGIACGHAWFSVAEACVVYTDLGISKGMRAGTAIARALGIHVELRELPGAEELIFRFRGR